MWTSTWTALHIHFTTLDCARNFLMQSSSGLINIH